MSEIEYNDNGGAFISGRPVPKIIAYVMRFSFGLISNEKDAEEALIVFFLLALAAPFFYWAASNHYKAPPPPDAQMHLKAERNPHN